MDRGLRSRGSPYAHALGPLAFRARTFFAPRCSLRAIPCASAPGGREGGSGRGAGGLVVARPLGVRVRAVIGPPAPGGPDGSLTVARPQRTRVLPPARAWWPPAGPAQGTLPPPSVGSAATCDDGSRCGAVREGPAAPARERRGIPRSEAPDPDGDEAVPSRSTAPQNDRGPAPRREGGASELYPEARFSSRSRTRRGIRRAGSRAASRRRGSGSGGCAPWSRPGASRSPPMSSPRRRRDRSRGRGSSARAR